jgi:hypothetical protein
MQKENIIINSIECNPRVLPITKDFIGVRKTLDVKVCFEYSGEIKNIEFNNGEFSIMPREEEIKDKIIEVLK